MLAIYKMSIKVKRMGYITGIFTADKDAVIDLIKNETEICLGEVLGKHSEIYVTIEPHEITEVTCDPIIVGIFNDLNMETGYNPFDYIEK